MLRRAFLLLPLLVSCRPAPALRKLSANSTVLCFGDSLTAGTGAEADESYPARLETILGCRVVNEGVPGDTVSGGTRRLPAALAQHRPQLVVLCLGGNDLLRAAEEDVVEEELAAMVRRCKAAGADVVLFAVPTPGIVLRPAKLYRRVARAEGVPLEEDAITEILSNHSLRADPIHPNAAGYAILAERIAAVIRGAGG
jgi:acyl-CoA thioesterase I